LLLMGMLCSDGDLQLVLRRAQSDLASAVGTLTREQWATIAMHVLQDLASLHALGWTHGDMQSTNVLVHVESGRATGWLCDLSCAEPALTGAATAVDVYGWATVFRQAFAACAHPADAAGAAGAADAANSFATALLSVTKAIIAKRAACCSAASLLRKLESLQTL
jgi:tRNA A-37 threonylcarbamoyl transferase component Bud32